MRCGRTVALPVALALAGLLESLSACGSRSELSGALPPARVDAGADATHADAGRDIATLDAARPDVVAIDVAAIDVADVATPDALDVAASDAFDVLAPDVVDVAAPDAHDAAVVDAPVCVPTGYGTASSYPFGNPLSEHPTFVATGDFDHDGHIDIAAVGGVSPSGAAIQGSVFLNRGDGTFGLEIPFTSGPWPNEIAAADFDHDGWLDLAVANSLPASGRPCVGGPECDSNVAIVYNRHGGAFSAPNYVGTGGSVGFSVAVGDMDRNGTLDVVTTDQGPGQLAVILATDGTHFAAPRLRALDLASYVRLADLDANGTLDVVVSVRSLHPMQFVTLFNDGTGALRDGATYSLGAPDRGSYGDPSFALGDLDGDGSIDLVAPGPGTQQLSVFHNRGDGTFGAPEAFDLPATPTSVVAVDADRDGRLDLGVLLTRSTPSWMESVGLLVNDGHGEFASPVESADLSPSHVGMADFNGDGYADFVTGNSSWVSVVLSRCR